MKLVSFKCEVFLRKFKKFKIFLGTEVWNLFRSSILVGLVWFLVESSFVFVLQGFFLSIGLISSKDTFLPDFYPSGVLGALSCLLLYGLLRSLVIVLKVYYSQITNQVFIRTKREHVLEYSLLNTKNVSSYEVFNIFNERIIQAASVIQQLSLFSNTFVSTFFFFMFGLYLAPYELMLGVFLLAIFVFPFNKLNRFISGFGIGLAEESKLLMKILSMGMKNHFILHIYNLAKEEIKKGKQAARSYERYFKKYLFLSSTKSAFPQFAGAVILTVVCYVSITYVKTDSMKLVSFIYVFMRLAQSLSELSSTVSAIRFQYANFMELYLWSEQKLRDDAGARSQSSYKASLLKNQAGISVKINDLRFCYENDRELFGGLSVQIQHGEVLVVKGPSGVGKSTLLSLILGLLKPKSGEILVNGAPIYETRSGIANSIAYVGPEPFIIEGTIRENLLYCSGRKNAGDKELWEALKFSQLNEFVASTNEKLEKKLREVTDLSTGQKQRLAIARALVRRPKLLVLDEATSNLDPKTEAQIVKLICEISKELTTVIITHKNSFDAIATEIIQLNRKGDIRS